MRHVTPFQAICSFVLFDVRAMCFFLRLSSMGGGWEGAAKLPLFVLFSLFSRPGARLATVESSCHGLATKTMNERKGKNNCLEFAMMYVCVCVSMCGF